MGAIKGIIFTAAVLIATGCAPTRVVKPLEKGEKHLSGSAGGPGIILNDVPILIPLSSVSYTHGLDTGVTFSGGFHTTSLAFGVLHADVGLGVRALQSKNERYGMTVSPALHLMYEWKEDQFRMYPQLEMIGWWQYSDRPMLVYGGIGTWVEFEKNKAHGQVQDNELMPWITAGYQVRAKRWTYSAEFKYLGFQHASNPVVVDYLSPGGQGALGFYIGLSRRFGP